MSIKGQGHSLTLVEGHSDFKVKCLIFGLYTQVSDSGPHVPLVYSRITFHRYSLCHYGYIRCNAVSLSLIKDEWVHFLFCLPSQDKSATGVTFGGNSVPLRSGYSPGGRVNKTYIPGC